jgi:hypothetical protein
MGASNSKMGTVFELNIPFVVKLRGVFVVIICTLLEEFIKYFVSCGLLVCNWYFE